MGLFGKNKKELLKWQKQVVVDSPDRLIMTEKQLKTISQNLASRDLEIIQDCLRILSSTVEPDTYFMRLKLLEEKCNHLVTLEEYVDFQGASPSSAQKEIENDRQTSIDNFIERFYIKTCEKADSLKTEKGKLNQYTKFKEALKPYYAELSKENRKFIEERTQRTVQGTDKNIDNS